MIEKRVMSQCISVDYCKGWNDAVEKANDEYARAYIKGFEEGMKSCFGKCDRCVWKENSGCSEWNGEKYNCPGVEAV